ncbi:hypothetical protein [Nocardioides sp. GXZ039]|uniref:hypothetical protein n=1 Tax=Nocardioides sp. GXZ039 TaxID=3136018 RepID=UPI0030F38288
MDSCALSNQDPLLVALEGWILDSGQSVAIVAGDEVAMGLELQIVDVAEGAARASASPGLRHVGDNVYDVVARARSTNPQSTVLEFGMPAYVRTETAERWFGPIVPGGVHALRVALCADPYVGRSRPRWLADDLVRSWRVAEIVRIDRFGARATTTTTAPAEATTSYLLTLEPAAATES